MGKVLLVRGHVMVVLCFLPRREPGNNGGQIAIFARSRKALGMDDI